MREYERISRISDKVKILWKHFPDMRYFQFMDFLVEQLGITYDIFFYEDDDFEKELDRLIGELECMH